MIADAFRQALRLWKEWRDRRELIGETLFVELKRWERE